MTHRDDHETIAAEIVGCFWSDAGNGEGLRNRIKHDLDSAYERGAVSVVVPAGPFGMTPQEAADRLRDAHVELLMLRGDRDELRHLVSTCPLGYVDGKLISTRSTTDADVIAWLQKLNELVAP